MGLVMQEPTLFNYTVQENILYGLDDAKNSEIRDAAGIANALEFIESEELLNSYEESASVLHKALIELKDKVLQSIT
jgi:ABC-type multidrug transport system fused ATPase/permease subunit